jgi:CBS domain-containing protein
MLDISMYKAKDVMTNSVITVGRETDIYKAIELMVDNNITGLPVVNDDMTLAGIVSEKDVLKLLYDKVGNLHKVENFMTKGVISFDQEDSLLDITDCLLKNRFRRVLISNGKRLVGVISRKDIISYIYKLSFKDKVAV